MNMKNIIDFNDSYWKTFLWGHVSYLQNLDLISFGRSAVFDANKRQINDKMLGPCLAGSTSN